MCYFLTIAFKKDYEEVVKTDFSAAGYHLQKNANPFFKKNFGSGAAAFDITDGHCSCAVYPLLLAGETVDETDKLRRAYRKKGWSESKIERAISDRATAHDRQKRAVDEKAFELRKTLASLYRQIGSYALFVHQYEGSMLDEQIDSVGERDLRIDELLDENTEVREDVIVKIKK